MRSAVGTEPLLKRLEVVLWRFRSLWSDKLGWAGDVVPAILMDDAVFNRFYDLPQSRPEAGTYRQTRAGDTNELAHGHRRPS